MAAANRRIQCHRRADANGHTHDNCDRYCHCNCDRHCYSNCYCYSYAHGDIDSDPEEDRHAQASSYAGAKTMIHSRC
jgi:hypothetical protein